MRAALIRRVTREGFMLSALPLFRAGTRPAETVFGLLHPRGTYRLRIGPRVAALEGREHDTPTGRCSSGSWGRIASYPTPTTVGEVGVTLAQVWAAILGEGTLSPTTFEGVTGYKRGDANRCGSRVNSDAVEPRATASGGGRGRTCRGLPGWNPKPGHGPANGKRVGTHDATAIRATVRREKRIERSREYQDYLNTRGHGKDLGVYPRRTR